MSLSPAVEASYTSIIDSILAGSDINTITSKRIRDGLQQAVNYDITPQKNVIKTLIMQRFDKFVAEKHFPPAPITNGHAQVSPPSPSPPAHHDLPISESPGKSLKRRTSTASSALPTPLDSPAVLPSSLLAPPPKKHKSTTPIDDDAAFAARLQAEENRRAGRTTRNTSSGWKVVPGKKKTSLKKKRKTADRVGPDDDGEMSDDGDEKKVNRNGGFHQQYTLSAPLSALLDGEVALSRPQTVKRLWAYIKLNNLQDPKDGRHICCDDAMRAVFKTDKVHMFTMNKNLTQNLYTPDE